MNLSKVYATQDSFEPENIIRVRLAEEPVFGASIIPSAPQGEAFQHQQLARKQAERPSPSQPDNHTGTTSQTPPAKESGQESPAEPGDISAREPQPQTPPARPASPPQPGIPQKEVDRLVAEAYEQGVADGMLRSEEDFGTAAASLLVACQQIDTLRETVIHNSVGEIRELVVAIAEKIIRHSVEQQDATILLTVEEAIDRAVKSGEYIIYVHPDDYQRVLEKAPDFVSAINGLNNIVVKRDPKIGRGGCLLESDNCTVDATISSQLDVIHREMEKM